MRLEIGSRLGPYEITGWIGAGGMGEVYRARDARLGREVAIKVLPRDVIRDADRVVRFQREASSASALNHRNIVTVHDFTCTADEAWLVMELIAGESLRDALSRGALPLKKVVAIGSGIAEGLAAAHAAGLVHRDLKPENVMVTSEGIPKILDFGLVKRTETVSGTDSPTLVMVSSAGVIMGTAAYMSPEQARGESLDFRTDQFSLGLVLHEMVTGKHPFARKTGVDTLAAILSEEPRPVGDDVPIRLREIVERCLSKQPQDRYGSTSDLAHDLSRAGTSTGRLSESPVPGTARRRWWPFALAGSLIAAAVAATLLTRIPARQIVAIDSYQVSLATPELTEVFRDEIAQSVAISPDGRFVVVYGADREALPALWLYDLRSGAKRLLAQNAFSVGWSPDSKSIAYFADGKLKTLSIEGGPARTICDARPESIPSWQGDTILFAQYSVKERGIYRVSARGGSPQRVVGYDSSRGGSQPIWPQLLGDEKHFLYMLLRQEGEGAFDHELYVASLEGGTPKKVAATVDSRVVYRNGILFVVRDGTLLAQPFDPGRAILTGEPSTLVTEVHHFRNTGLAAFSVSDNGVVAWRAPVPPSRLVWFDKAGVELKDVGAAASFARDGRFSPDGRRYAVGIIDPKQGVADLWVYDLERESSERITFRGADEKRPVWASDGRSIFYRSDALTGPPDILRWAPGSEAGTPVHAGRGVEEPHDVSPDGRSMLFVERHQAAVGDIHLLPLEPKGAARPWLATPFNESSPRFSPDGQWVAYDSNFSGRPEVYVRALNGVATSARISRSGGTLPRWSRDGKELFFLAPDGRIMSSAMQDGASIGSPRILFQAAEAVAFEPAHDGQRFLVQLQQQTTEPTVQLLINWPARMRTGSGAGQ